MTKQEILFNKLLHLGFCPGSGAWCKTKRVCDASGSRNEYCDRDRKECLCDWLEAEYVKVNKETLL